MITLYLISSIGIALMMICDIFILTYPHLSIKKYPIFFLSFSALFFIMAYFTFYPMLFVILAINSILLVKFTKKLYSVFYIPISYIFSNIFGNLTGFAFNLLWGLSVKELNAHAFYIICHLYNNNMLSYSLPGQTIASEVFYQYF